MGGEYERLQEQGAFTGEFEAQAETLRDAATTESNSFWVIMMAGTTLMAVGEDGTISQEEGELMTELARFVEENPNAGVMDMGSFVDQNPRMQEIFQDVQGQMQQLGVESPPQGPILGDDQPPTPQGDEAPAQ
jgi:hypothetical protein